MSCELYSDIQSFVLIFVEIGRKRTHVYIGSAILTRFLHDHWGHCEIFARLYLKSDRAYFKNTNILQDYFYLVGEKHIRETTYKNNNKKAGTRLAGKIPACLILLAKRIFQGLLFIKMACLKYLLKMSPRQ